MECSEPGAIRDDELLAYIDGVQVRPAVLAHLAHCQYCSAQLATYKRMDHKLIQKLYRWDCPDSQILGEYQLNLLDREQSTEIQDHLKRCALCATEIATLTNFLANDPLLVERTSASLPVITGQGQTSVPTNSHGVLDARHVIEQWSAEGIATVRRVVATLLSPQPRLAYQRDVTDATTQWPRRYSAEGLTISIQVERTPQHAHQRSLLQLLGLVTSDDKALEDLQGTSVVLSSQTKGDDGPDQVRHSQVIDDLGNFIFSALEPDTYALELQLPERIVVIDQLSLTL
jgi:hypothetical protein